MAKHLTADDILPLVACLPRKERARLLRLIASRPNGSEVDAYDTLPPFGNEFSSDEEPLAWDASGWEHIA